MSQGLQQQLSQGDQYKWLICLGTHLKPHQSSAGTCMQEEIRLWTLGAKQLSATQSQSLETFGGSTYELATQVGLSLSEQLHLAPTSVTVTLSPVHT